MLACADARVFAVCACASSEQVRERLTASIVFFSDSPLKCGAVVPARMDFAVVRMRRCQAELPLDGAATLQIHCEQYSRDEGAPDEGRRVGKCFRCAIGLTAGVLAIATDFHHMRLLGLFAILATVFAVFLRRAIAGRMRAFVFVVLCHKTFPAFWIVRAEVDRKTPKRHGQGPRRVTRVAT